MRIDDALARSADGLCAVDARGVITDWNEAAERVLGHRAADVVGRPCCDVFGGRDDRGNLFCYPGCQILTLAGMGEPVHHFELDARHRRGRRVRLQVSILVLDGARRGGLQRTVHLFREAAGPAARGRDGGPSEALAVLTRREVQVLGLLATGLDSRAIAVRLHISPATVRNHAQNILGKIGAHNRLEAAAWAHRHGIVPPAAGTDRSDTGPAVRLSGRRRRHDV